MRPRRTSARRDRGAVIPMVALSLTILMTMTAFAVDLGRMRTERRSLQADADAIALDAVQAIYGMDGVTAQPAAVAEANLSAARNGLSVTLTDEHVKVGKWDVGTQSFQYLGGQANVFPDAVQVDLSSVVEMFFDFTADDRSVSRRAVAVSRGTTMGELGSVVAGIQPAPVPDPTTGCAIGVAASVQMTVMNHIYTKLLGIEVSGGVQGSINESVDENLDCQISGPGDGLQLDAASYKGLAANRVTFRDLAAAGGYGSPSALASQSLTQKGLLELAATVLQSGEDPTSTRYKAGTQLLAIAGGIDTTTSFVVGDVFKDATGTPQSSDPIDASTGGSDSVGDASVNVLDMLFATATAIDGNNFVGGETGTAVPLPLGADGSLVSVPMKVHVIQRPQLDLRPKHAGEQGPRTSQVSVALDVPVGVSNLPMDLSTLGIPGISEPNTANASGTLPLVIEVGQATSRYPSIQCPVDGTPPTVDMTVTSGAARVQVGATTDTNFADGVTVTTPGSIVAGTSTVTTLNLVSLLKVEGQVDMAVSTNVPSFGQTFTAAGATVLDTGTDLTAGGGEATNPFTFVDPGPTDWFRYRGGFSNVAVADSTFASYDFATTSDDLIGLLDLADSDETRHAVVQEALDPVLQQLDTTVLQPIFNALGVTVGGADARIHEVRCQVPALANRG